MAIWRTVENHIGCCLQVLQPPHGVVYVAAKSFYFGVGGSTASFADLVKADGVLECTQVDGMGCLLHRSCVMWATTCLLLDMHAQTVLGLAGGPALHVGSFSNTSTA